MISHSYMYGKGNFRIWDWVVESRTMPLFAYSCNKNGLHFVVEVDQRGCRQLMWADDASSDCRHQVTQKLGLVAKANKKFVEIAKVLKTPPILIYFMCFTLPLPLFGCLSHQ